MAPNKLPPEFFAEMEGDAVPFASAPRHFQRTRTRVDELIEQIDLPARWVRTTLLPSWWNDDAALDDAGLAEAHLILAQRAGFGRALPVSPTTIATQLAHTVAPVCTTEPQPVSSQLASVHELVERCWAGGLPVLLTTHFPPGVPKPDAVFAERNGRKLLVLTTDHISDQWLASLIKGVLAPCPLDPNSAAVTALREAALANLNWSQLSEDSIEFVMTMLGLAR